MPAQPTGQPGLMRIPAPNAKKIVMRYAPLSQRDKFDPSIWPVAPLTAMDPGSPANPGNPGWWEVDVDLLALGPGPYEYEFVVDGDGDHPIADPFADEITRFDGYRGVLHISGGRRIRLSFDWSDEFVTGKNLAPNNAIVIYEMPVKWMSSDPIENPLVELGTLEKVVFEQLDRLAGLGINCIELLPIEDTSQTLDWGYGTRFYFAPDYDLGSPIDARYFVKACHRRGIRVLMDVVMAFFSTTCPLAKLALDWFSVPNGTDNRHDWGQYLFKYNTLSGDGTYAARDFLLYMGEFWTSEYHIDGFRIDDFEDIGNWEFVQQFKIMTHAAAEALAPGKPFIVVAEDTYRNFHSTYRDPLNNGLGPVVDAIWNFGYRDEIRRLIVNQIYTVYGQESRSDRVRGLVSMSGVWNQLTEHPDDGFGDMANSVAYATSHDVADAPRIMTYLLDSILGEQTPGSESALETAEAVSVALYRAFGVFALLLTSVGIPMFLAGEEFGDVNDLDFRNGELKQQDPVQFRRLSYLGNKNLQDQVGLLIALRTTHAALQRNEVDPFYFDTKFDDNDSARVFGYARTAGNRTGSVGQVVVIANMGPQEFPSYALPDWPWQNTAQELNGSMGPWTDAPKYDPGTRRLTLGLGPFQVRVFTT